MAVALLLVTTVVILCTRRLDHPNRPTPPGTLWPPTARARRPFSSPVGVEVHAHVLGMLAQEPQVGAGAGPSHQRHGKFLRRGQDDVQSPDLARSCATHAIDVVKPGEGPAVACTKCPVWVGATSPGAGSLPPAYPALRQHAYLSRLWTPGAAESSSSKSFRMRSRCEGISPSCACKGGEVVNGSACPHHSPCQ